MILIFRYYAGPGNHFWKLLHASGLTPTLVNFEQDYKLVEYGIGLTNIVSRATKSSAELTKLEIKEGAKIIEDKLRLFRPKVAVFNGKCIYEVFANKHNFNFGLQPDLIDKTAIWVVPSSSARCSNYPRMTDKLHFYTALKKYLDYIKGNIGSEQVLLSDFVFEGKCKPAIPSTSKMWRRKKVSSFLAGGRVANSEMFCLDTSDEAIACSTEFVLSQILDEKTAEEKEEDCEKKIIVKSEAELDGGVEEKKVTNIKVKSVSKTVDYVGLIKRRIMEKQQQVEDVSSSEEQVVEEPDRKLKNRRSRAHI